MKSIPLVLGLLLAAGAATAQQYTISTFAGIGTSPGFYPVPGDGAVSAPSAQMYSPGALALDKSGNLYVNDYLSYVIWEVSNNAVNPPIVGTTSPGSAGDDGPATLATIYQVRGLAIDPGGNLYIADAGSANLDREGWIALSNQRLVEARRQFDFRQSINSTGSFST